MLYRKIEKYIVNHLQSRSDKILVIDGARQIGKSYIIREVGKKLFPNFIEINMETDKVGDRTFADAKTVDDFYMALSIVAGDRMKEKNNTLVFIDEIQAYDHLLTLLKFLREDNKFTYICSGSLLGVTLKTTSSIPLGSIEIKHMYPLDFEEFLIANGDENLVKYLDSINTIEPIPDAFFNPLYEKLKMYYIAERSSMPEAIHNKLLDLFKKYLLVGGLPDAVNEFVATKNITAIRKIQDNIHHLYGVDAARYEEIHNRLKIQRIYGMVPSNLENKKKRIVAKNIENKQGKRMSDYLEEFDYLISSGITLEVKAISKPSFPLIENSGKNLLKLYMNDVGILTNIFFGTNIKAVLDDIASINLGSVYETVVAQELKAHGFNLYYYDNKKIGEVDYLIDDRPHLSVLPIEVKSGKDYQVHSALDKFLKIKEYNIHEAFVLSNAQQVEVKDGITYLPIYYIMCIEAEDPDKDIYL